MPKYLFEVTYTAGGAQGVLKDGGRSDTRPPGS